MSANKQGGGRIVARVLLFLIWFVIAVFLDTSISMTYYAMFGLQGNETMAVLPSFAMLIAIIYPGGKWLWRLTEKREIRSDEKVGLRVGLVVATILLWFGVLLLATATRLLIEDAQGVSWFNRSTQEEQLASNLPSCIILTVMTYLLFYPGVNWIRRITGAVVPEGDVKSPEVQGNSSGKSVENPPKKVLAAKKKVRRIASIFPVKIEVKISRPENLKSVSDPDETVESDENCMREGGEEVEHGEDASIQGAVDESHAHNSVPKPFAAKEIFTCSGCGSEWGSNYCPVCQKSFDGQASNISVVDVNFTQATCTPRPLQSESSRRNTPLESQGDVDGATKHSKLGRWYLISASLLFSALITFSLLRINKLSADSETADSDWDRLDKTVAGIKSEIDQDYSDIEATFGKATKDKVRADAHAARHTSKDEMRAIADRFSPANGLPHTDRARAVKLFSIMMTPREAYIDVMMKSGMTKDEANRYVDIRVQAYEKALDKRLTDKDMYYFCTIFGCSKEDQTPDPRYNAQLAALADNLTEEEVELTMTRFELAGQEADEATDREMENALAAKEAASQITKETAQDLRATKEAAFADAEDQGIDTDEYMKYFWEHLAENSSLKERSGAILSSFDMNEKKFKSPSVKAHAADFMIEALTTDQLKKIIADMFSLNEKDADAYMDEFSHRAAALISSEMSDLQVCYYCVALVDQAAVDTTGLSNALSKREGMIETANLQAELMQKAHEETKRIFKIY